MIALTLQTAPPRQGNEEILQGKLHVDGGKPSLITESGRMIPLASSFEDIDATLSDDRLSDRPARVLGRTRPDGTFSVRLFYIVRPESLYRIVYHCGVCNITTFAPGDCMCCQAPTIPVEVLPTDPRIYHSEADSRPPR